MSKKHTKLIYALKNDKIIYIDDVESGLKCGCVCPACGEKLIAKKGAKMMHHFAHNAGTNCEHGYETSLHLAAKEILSEVKKFTIPPVYVEFPNSHKKHELISESKEIPINKVELEKKFNDIIPDIIVYSGKKLLFIEIYVTHGIDEEKLKRIKKSDISTIEIDLSKHDSDITKEELMDILLGDSGEKKWIYNTVAEKKYQQLCNIADKRKVTELETGLYVHNCPIKSRICNRKVNADFLNDCLECTYLISMNYKNDDSCSDILCSGNQRVVTVNDLCISNEKRIKNSNEHLDNLREISLTKSRCPYCNSYLVQKQGKYGIFLGCSKYPFCDFTAPIDPITGTVKI